MLLKYNQPNVFSFDQFIDNRDYIKKHVNNNKISIVIDDGCHQSSAIINTFKSFLPHLEEQFVYIIEDNKGSYQYFRKHYYNKFNIYKVKANVGTASNLVIITNK